MKSHEFKPLPRIEISFQAPPTPTFMLYFLSQQGWYSLEVPGASPVSAFELHVAPSTYPVIVFPVGTENQSNRPAVPSSTGSGIGFLTVVSDQLVECIHVQDINSDMCVIYPFRPSPDERFPALDANCN